MSLRKTQTPTNRRLAAAALALAALATAPAGAVRLKDIAQIGGVRENQLIGYGVVVGLNGTGDDSDAEFTAQSVRAFLRRYGVTVSDEVELENSAGVIVTASLPAFSRPGTKIDVQVSSFGDCENLQGGTLLMTPLKGPDGKVYALAQGPLTVGGFKASQGGTSVQENHPTVGVISNGATVERGVAVDLSRRSQLEVMLKNPDFVTARRVAEAINGLSDGQPLAHPVDAATIGVLVPAGYRGRLVEFIAHLESVPVNPDTPARIVLDERTGTVIMGKDVRISTVAVAYGSLSILITSENTVSQPPPFSDGRTMPVTNTGIQVNKEGGPRRNLSVVEEGVTISELVSALNALGVSPRDLISILQAIKAAGALQADLEVI